MVSMTRGERWVYKSMFSFFEQGRGRRCGRRGGRFIVMRKQSGGGAGIDAFQGHITWRTMEWKFGHGLKHKQVALQSFWTIYRIDGLTLFHVPLVFRPQQAKRSVCLCNGTLRMTKPCGHGLVAPTVMAWYLTVLALFHLSRYSDGRFPARLGAKPERGVESVGGYDEGEGRCEGQLTRHDEPGYKCMKWRANGTGPTKERVQRPGKPGRPAGRPECCVYGRRSR